MPRQTDTSWPTPPEIGEPLPPKDRRPWGKVTHADRYRKQRRDLLRAAARLASTTGYDGTRVGDIVAEAGLSKSTFYEHFSSKEDCFVELYRRTSAGMLRAGIEAAEASDPARPYPSILAVVRALVGYVGRDPRLADVMRAELGASQPAIRRQREENFERIIELFVALGRRVGSPLSAPELELTATVIIHGVTAIMPDLRRSDDLDERLQHVARLGCRALGLDAEDG